MTTKQADEIKQTMLSHILLRDVRVNSILQELVLNLDKINNNKMYTPANNKSACWITEMVRIKSHPSTQTNS